MSKMTEKVARAIATKFLKGIEGFRMSTLENYKDNFVFLAVPEGVTGEINVGLPIYVLVNPKGEARHATRTETRELLIRGEDDDDEEEEDEPLEFPPM